MARTVPRWNRHVVKNAKSCLVALPEKLLIVLGRVRSHLRKCQSIHRLISPPRKNPTPTAKKPIRAKRWFGNGFVLNR
jgi:hypothetical protein